MDVLAALCIWLLLKFGSVGGYLSNSPHIITFWGQDPALQDADKVATELNKTCAAKSSYSTVVLGFVNKSYKNKTTASLPPMHCTKSKESRSKLSLYCPEVAKDLERCHQNKKKVLIGVGGPNETLYFDDAKSAESFAKKIWNWFLGGTEISEMRPFGRIALDGVDLFLKDENSKHVDVFLKSLNELRKKDPFRKYTYTMSVPCNAPDLYFGEGRDRLSKSKIIPLMSQIYVRYSGKQCCRYGPKHFRRELHEWKKFAVMPKSPDLFVLFPRSPHKTMTNCFSSNRQLSILHNIIKLKMLLGEFISTRKREYLRYLTCWIKQSRQLPHNNNPVMPSMFNISIPLHTILSLSENTKSAGNMPSAAPAEASPKQDLLKLSMASFLTPHVGTLSNKYLPHDKLYPQENLEDSSRVNLNNEFKEAPETETSSVVVNLRAEAAKKLERLNGLAKPNPAKQPAAELLDLNLVKQLASAKFIGSSPTKVEAELLKGNPANKVESVELLNANPPKSVESTAKSFKNFHHPNFKSSVEMYKHQMDSITDILLKYSNKVDLPIAADGTTAHQSSMKTMSKPSTIKPIHVATSEGGKGAISSKSDGAISSKSDAGGKYGLLKSLYNPLFAMPSSSFARLVSNPAKYANPANIPNANLAVAQALQTKSNSLPQPQVIPPSIRNTEMLLKDLSNVLQKYSNFKLPMIKLTPARQEAVVKNIVDNYSNNQHQQQQDFRSDTLQNQDRTISEILRKYNANQIVENQKKTQEQAIEKVLETYRNNHIIQRKKEIEDKEISSILDNYEKESMQLNSLVPQDDDYEEADGGNADKRSDSSGMSRYKREGSQHTDCSALIPRSSEFKFDENLKSIKLLQNHMQKELDELNDEVKRQHLNKKDTSKEKRTNLHIYFSRKPEFVDYDESISTREVDDTAPEPSRNFHNEKERSLFDLNRMFMDPTIPIERTGSPDKSDKNKMNLNQYFTSNVHSEVLGGSGGGGDGEVTGSGSTGAESKKKHSEAGNQGNTDSHSNSESLNDIFSSEEAVRATSFAHMDDSLPDNGGLDGANKLRLKELLTTYLNTITSNRGNPLGFLEKKSHVEQHDRKINNR